MGNQSGAWSLMIGFLTSNDVRRTNLPALHLSARAPEAVALTDGLRVFS